MRFNHDLSQVSRMDTMTGLLNRAAFESCLAQEHALSVSAREVSRTRPYSVIMLDVDHFKAYNDAHGHPAGDRCLIEVAKAVQATVRRTDFVGRYGGEEIIAPCPGMDTDEATGLAERLRQAVRDCRIEHPHPEAGPIVTVSVGLAHRRPGRIDAQRRGGGADSPTGCSTSPRTGAGTASSLRRDETWRDALNLIRRKLRLSRRCDPGRRYVLAGGTRPWFRPYYGS